MTDIHTTNIDQACPEDDCGAKHAHPYYHLDLETKRGLTALNAYPFHIYDNPLDITITKPGTAERLAMALTREQTLELAKICINALIHHDITYKDETRP